MRILLCAGLALAVAGCGGSGSGGGACGAAPVVGTWSGHEIQDTLVFSADCSLTSSYCEMVGTYPPITASSGSVLVNITATNGRAGCASPGQKTCTYALSTDGTGLAFNCGGSDLSYTKQ